MSFASAGTSSMEKALIPHQRIQPGERLRPVEVAAEVECGTDSGW